MKDMDEVIADIRQRAEHAHDAWLNDPDETVHHEAVSGMLLNIAEAVETAYRRSRRVKQAAVEVINAIKLDREDDHRTERGLSGVILNGVGEAKDHLTSRFNDLIDDLEDAINEAED